MVRCTVHGDSTHLVFSCDSAEIRPEPILKYGRDDPLASLGAEHAMDVLANVGMRHNSVVPTGLICFRAQPSVETLGWDHDVPPGREE